MTAGSDGVGAEDGGLAPLLSGFDSAADRGTEIASAKTAATAKGLTWSFIGLFVWTLVTDYRDEPQSPASKKSAEPLTPNSRALYRFGELVAL